MRDAVRFRLYVRLPLSRCSIMDASQLAVISARLAYAQHDAYDANRGRERLRDVVRSADSVSFLRWASQGILHDVSKDRVIYYSCSAREYVSLVPSMYGGSLVHELVDACGSSGRGGKALARYAQLLEVLVLQHGCDVNAINLLGRSPLHHYVCAFGDASAVQPSSSSAAEDGEEDDPAAHHKKKPSGPGSQPAGVAAVDDAAHADECSTERAQGATAMPSQPPPPLPRWGLVTTLLELGADVEAPDAAGFTPSQLLYKKLSALVGKQRAKYKETVADLAEDRVDASAWAQHPSMKAVKQIQAQQAEVLECLRALSKGRQEVQSVRSVQVARSDEGLMGVLGTPWSAHGQGALLKGVLSAHKGARPAQAGGPTMQPMRSFFQPPTAASAVQASAAAVAPAATGAHEMSTTGATPGRGGRQEPAFAQYGSPEVLQAAVDVSTDSELSGVSGTPSPAQTRRNRGLHLTLAGNSPPEWRPLVPISSLSGTSMHSLTSKLSGIALSDTGAVVDVRTDAGRPPVVDAPAAAVDSALVPRPAPHPLPFVSPPRPSSAAAEGTLSTLPPTVPAGTPRRPLSTPALLPMPSPAAMARAAREVLPTAVAGAQTTLWASVPQAAVEQVRLSEAYEGIRRQQGWAYYAVLLCDRRPPGQESLPSTQYTGFLGREAAHAGLPAKPNPSSVLSRVDACIAMSPQLRSEERSTGRLPPLVEVRRIRPLEGSSQLADSVKYSLRMCEDPESGYCVAAAIGPFIDPLPLLGTSDGQSRIPARALSAAAAAKECAKWWSYGMQAAYKVRVCVSGCCKEEQIPALSSQDPDTLAVESDGSETAAPLEPAEPSQSGQRYQLKQVLEGRQGSSTSEEDRSLSISRCPQRHGSGLCEWSALAWAKALGKLPILAKDTGSNVTVRQWLRPYRSRARWFMKRTVFPALGSTSPADRKDVWARSVLVLVREYEGRRGDFAQPISLLGSAGASEGAGDAGGESGPAAQRYLGRGSPARALGSGVLPTSHHAGNRASMGETINPDGHRAVGGTHLRTRLNF